VLSRGQVEFKYCPSAMNVSDCFTKSLGPRLQLMPGWHGCGHIVLECCSGFCGPSDRGVLCMTVQHALDAVTAYLESPILLLLYFT
jgi:hypothetical protein